MHESSRLIRRVESWDVCRVFAASFDGDPQFSDPMLCDEEQLRCNLIRPIEEPEGHCALAVYNGEEMTGLFTFLLLRQERYMEMLAGLSRDGETYAQLLRWLEQHFPGYGVDFVCNPGNWLLREQLDRRGAVYEPEQRKLVLETPPEGIDTDGVEPLSRAYAAQYREMHHTDMYWTGERVMQAQDRFRTLLAIREGQVVGYLDVTRSFRKNEPYDLLVREEYRRRGYGRRLLARALELNRPNGMMVLLDADNEAAIRLYTSLGFVQAQGQSQLLAHWTIPEREPGN